MKLPPTSSFTLNKAWSDKNLEGWSVLKKELGAIEGEAGETDAFNRLLIQWERMADTGVFDNLHSLLKSRMGARSLTKLWLEDDAFRDRLLSVAMLKALIEAQKPRLTRLTLIQLIQLYFKFFDQLPSREVLEQLQCSILEQLDVVPSSSFKLGHDDILSVLQQKSKWLLSQDGPIQLVSEIQSKHQELADAFVFYGLKGFDTGRYGDVCRAMFYLETLKSLEIGLWDPVLDELLKPSVSKAPYQEGRRIGHAALEIIIDRVVDMPSEDWQSFVLTLAGDPRIASSATNYRDWWIPLGEARIEKVRSWLAKEDLKLFLKAVEQYGIDTSNGDLQRMFPARKIFLEGLLELKLIRRARLLLGRTAWQSVRGILPSDVKTNFSVMSGNGYNDKAVILLDCGDFFMVEGSHNISLRIFLGLPSGHLFSYDYKNFSYEILNKVLNEHRKKYPKIPFEVISHQSGWQNKAFQFFAENGIDLDIEKLLSESDYQVLLRRFGLPVVKGSAVVAR